MSVELFQSAELSDLGRKRKNNEDACLRIPEKGVYCVADGMGGVVGGDLASEAITTNVHEAFAKAAPEQCDTLSGEIELLRAAANKASKWIKDFADEKVIGQMGSTLVGLVFDPRNPSRAVALHAGDSRLYRFRDGNLQQLTADHTAAAALSAKLGRDPSTLPAKYHNELARAVGLKESVELEQTRVQAKSGDVFLLCSDGLSRMAPDKTIGKVLSRAAKEDLSAVARELIHQANEAGGKDNITVVLVKVGDISSFPSVEPETKEPMPPAAPPASETDTEMIVKDDHNPPTPDTARDERGNTPTPQKPPTASTPRKSPPAARGASPNRAPLIAGVLVLAAAGVLAYYLFPRNKPQTADGTMDITHLTSSNPAPNFDDRPPKTPESAPKPPPPAPATGGLVIESDPLGVDVFSNDTRVGATPYEAGGLQPGQRTYQLRTTTNAGMIVAEVVAGATNTFHAALSPRAGFLDLNSDPADAQAWVDGKPMGNTPVHLKLDAGEHQLALKHPPLAELDSSWTVVADASSQTNASFACGGVEINSEPTGAEVRYQEQFVGRAPFTTNQLPPGPMTFRLFLPDYEGSNVIVQVPSDHSLASVKVELKHLPVIPPAAEVKLAPTTNNPPAAHIAGSGRVWTNDLDRVIWTNRLGMVFLKIPLKDLWVQTTRITRDQFQRETGRDPRELADPNENQAQPQVTLERAALFAASLTASLQLKNELPPGCETWRLAIPTSAQWLLAATNSNSLGLGMEQLDGIEWCRDGNGPNPAVYCGRYMAARKMFVAAKLDPDDVPQTKMSLRLVLTPPDSSSK